MSNLDVNKQHYNNFYGDGEGIFQYLENSGGSRWFRALLGDLVKNIDKNEIHSIVDLGCGVGVKSAFMAKQFPKAKVIGCDFAEPAIQKANEYWKYKNLSFSTEDVTSNDSNKYDIVKNNFNLLERYNAGFPLWSPILRDITNFFYKEYAEITYHKMSKIAYMGHLLCYIFLRYFSFKKIGDQCLLLFKRKI